MINSHYVPRLILRKFSDKLSLYNVKTGELKENISLERAYAIGDYYDSETEKNLSNKIESQFGDLLANHILKCDKEISLSRNQMLITKKFLLVSILRGFDERFLINEKYFYINLEKEARERPDFNEANYNFPPQQKEVLSETIKEYWLRSINVVLDTDGTPQEILKHPEMTHVAYRWSEIVNAAYLSFWDSPDGRDEFVITDVGMTSENEKCTNGIPGKNHRKCDIIKRWYEKEENINVKSQLYETFRRTAYFHENYEMFPISPHRMIVLVCPFFKLRYLMKESGIKVPPLEELTVLSNEKLYEPNRNFYKLRQILGESLKYHEDDRYIYDAKTLSSEEIRYCNALFLDRIDTYLGFSSLEHAVGSIIKYKKLNDPPHVPRVDYTGLYKIIQERYLGSLNV